MRGQVYASLIQKKKERQKSFAVLIDPDKVRPENVDDLISLAIDAKVDYFLVGGSLVVSDHLDECVLAIKKNCSIPLILVMPILYLQIKKRLRFVQPWPVKC